MACKLYGQVNIELLGTKETEIVLEGNLSAESLKGQIDIYLDGAQNIFLEGGLNGPYLEGTIETTLELEGCMTYVQNTTYLSGCTEGSVFRLYSSDISDFISFEIGSGVYHITPNGYLAGGPLDEECFIPIPPIDYDTIYAENYTTVQYEDCIICQSSTNLTPTPTSTVTPTLTVTPTITPSITPSITPTPSVSWDYFSAPTICCDSTDTPITGNIAIQSSYLLDSGDITILNGHAYTLGIKQPAVGDETFITDVVGDFSTCEQAVSYAVYLSGTTSGCRYTFSACCGVDSLVYV